VSLLRRFLDLEPSNQVKAGLGVLALAVWMLAPVLGPLFGVSGIDAGFWLTAIYASFYGAWKIKEGYLSSSSARSSASE